MGFMELLRVRLNPERTLAHFLERGVRLDRQVSYTPPNMHA